MKKNLLNFFILFLAIQQISYSQCPDWLWAKSGISNRGSGMANCVDAQGNVAITGYYEDTITFGSVVLADTGAQSIFVAKYDSSGNVLWAKTSHWTGSGSNTNNNKGLSIASDAAGNVIISGHYNSNYIAFDTITLGLTGSIFIVKYDPAGSVLWAKTSSTLSASAAATGITTDINDNVIVTGHFGNLTLTLDGIILNNAGPLWSSDIFLAKYDPSGNILWAKSAGGTDGDMSAEINSDSSGNVVITGLFNSPAITFDSTTSLTNVGINCPFTSSSDVYVAKYDASGNLLWAKSAGGFCNDRGFDVKTDVAGNVLVTGLFESDTLSFDSIDLININATFPDVFLAKFDASGNILWAKSAGGLNDDKGLSVSSDGAGNIYMTGGFNSPSISFDFITLTPPGGAIEPMFIVKYNSDGNVLCAGALSGGGSPLFSGFYPQLNAISLDNSGNAYTTGRFWTNPFIVGNDSLTLTGVYNVFTAKAVLTSLFVWPGDADEDLVANNYDLLPLGLYYGSIGPARDTISNIWVPHSAPEWSGIQSNGANYKFADCNGDGAINTDDTLAINLNYGFTHTYKLGAIENTATAPSLHFVTQYSSYLPGAWIDVDIWVSDTANPISLYGIAFNINYDISLVQPGTVSLLYPPSWLGTPGNDAIKIDNTTSDVQGAITRINQANANGYGKISTLRFQASTGIMSAAQFHINFTNYRAYDAAGNLITFNLIPDSILIDPALSIENISNESSLTIFPNPSGAAILISYYNSVNSANTSIEIYNTKGKLIKSSLNEEPPPGMHHLKIDIKDFEQGIYFLKIKAGEKIFTKKLVKI